MQQDANHARSSDMRHGKNEEFLAFTLGAEEYGVATLKVQEIRGYESPTRIANAPDHIMGVINLRGLIVPILDLRIRFGTRTPKYDQFTVVIILNIGQRVVGIVVDSVSDVITLAPGQIRPVPELGTALDTDYLIGMGTIGQRMLILVNIDKLLISSDIGIVEELTV